MRPDLHVDRALGLSVRLVSLIEDQAERAQAGRGVCAIALPGGSVASIFFPDLARAQCDWTRTAFFWGDERAVPPDDPESNYRVARRLWLEPANVPERRVHRMPAEAPDLTAAARAYEDEMARVLGAPPRLDVALLGVGPDGHVCSLFPGHPLLDERTRLVAAVGDSKAAVLRAALEDAASELPVAQAIRGARRAVVLLDPPAASLLKR